jgi:hypothetical protein
MTEYSASRGFMYASLPGTEETEGSESGAESVATASGPAAADD